MTQKFWTEIKECFNAISIDENCRSVVLSGVGTAFSSGIDLTIFGNMMAAVKSDDTARRAFHLRRVIRDFQESLVSLESCLKPIVAAIHGPCIGGAVNLVCFADIRLASNNAWFQLKETEIGLAPDIGALQRLPRLVSSDSLARELVYTARKMLAEEAAKCGFVSEVVDGDREAVVAKAMEIATRIAELSPVAIQASKAALIYSRDHSTAEGMLMQADWNQVMLQSEDLIKSVMASMQKEKPIFAKL